VKSVYVAGQGPMVVAALCGRQGGWGDVNKGSLHRVYVIPFRGDVNEACIECKSFLSPVVTGSSLADIRKATVGDCM